MDANTEFLNNPLRAWAMALAIAFAINVAVGLAKVLIVRRLSVLARNTATHFDDAVVEMVGHTRQWLILLATLYVGTRYLDLPLRVDNVLRSVATVGAFIQAGLWGNALLSYWVRHSTEKALQTDPGAATGLSALSVVARVALWAIVALLALDNLGINVTALVAGLGVGGIAVALAVQNILGDLLASLSIVIDKPFVRGDFIVVDDCMGTVEHVGLKTTRVRSLSGEQLIFSNGDLLKARLRNYKRMNERRAVFGFGVLYQTTPEQVKQIPGIVSEIIRRQPLTRFDRAHFKSFGDSSLDFEAVYWILDPDYNKYMDIQQAINVDLMVAFADAGIGFAYPTRTISLEGPIRVHGTEPAASLPSA